MSIDQRPIAVILSICMQQPKQEAKALILPWRKKFYIGVVFFLHLCTSNQASANDSAEALYAEAVEAWSIAVGIEENNAAKIEGKIELLIIAENLLKKIMSNYPYSDLAQRINSRKDAYHMPSGSVFPMEQEEASTLRLSDIIHEKHISLRALEIENCIAYSTINCLISVAMQSIEDNNQSSKTRSKLRCIAARLATTVVANDTITMSRQINSQYDRSAVLHLISIAFAEAGYIPIAIKIARQIDNGHFQADAISEIVGGVHVYLDRKEECP